MRRRAAGATLTAMGRNRGPDWFRQARDDLLWAEDTLRAGRYAQACFVAQQVAEKAIASRMVEIVAGLWQDSGGPPEGTTR